MVRTSLDLTIDSRILRDPKTTTHRQIREAVHRPGTVATVGEIVKPELFAVVLGEIVADFGGHPVARIEFVAVRGIEQYALQTADELRPKQPRHRLLKDARVTVEGSIFVLHGLRLS